MKKEWGGDIKIQEMTVGERLALIDRAEKQPEENHMFFWIITCCINEDGKKLFDEEDIPLLKQKNSEAVLKLFNEIKQVCLENSDLDTISKNS